MPQSRTLIVVLLLAILAAVGIWMFRSDDTGPVAPPSGAATAQPDNAAASSVSADVAQGGVGAAPETSTRVAAPVEAGAGAANGAALVGQVIDERGNPVATAVVTCTPGFGGFDFDSADAFDPETAFDSDAWRERLQAQRRERTETTTDGEGRFRIGVAGKSNSAYLRVRAPSHVMLEKGVTRPVGKDNDVGVLTLKSGAAVSGRVLDRAGSPIVGARVSREAAGPDNSAWGDFDFGGEEFVDAMDTDGAVTDAEGKFALLYCEAGKFALRARHADHPSARLDGLAVEAGGKLTDLLIVAEPGTTIRGRIVGVPEGTKPLRVMARKASAGASEAGSVLSLSGVGEATDIFTEANVGFGERQVRCNPDFTFELRGLHLGKSYRVWGSQVGRGFAGNTTCTEPLEVASGTAGLELRYDPGITVTFQVLAARTHAPIERLAVRDQLRSSGGRDDTMFYMPRSARPKAYPEGRVTIANLRPKAKQTLSLTIEALGFAPFERKNITLPSKGALDLGILELEPAPVLQVTVTSGPGRQPVAGANVRVSAAPRGDGAREQAPQFDGFFPGGNTGPMRSAKTDKEGRCALNVVAGGAMVVNVSSKDLAPYASEPITLKAGESGSHEVVLVTGGTVEVTVVDDSGAVLKEARVERNSTTGGRSSKQTNQDGVALFEHLSPGEHRFRLGSGGRGEVAFDGDFGGPGLAFAPERKQDEAGWQRIAVEDGGKATLQLAKEPMATLRGIVRENGVPLAGARVSFVEGQGEPAAGSEVAGAFAGPFEELGGGGNRSARTTDDGSYQLKDLPAGAHRLRITAKGRVSPSQVTLALRQGENVVDVELDVTIVRGTVRDSAGKPIAGASVSIVPTAPEGNPRRAEAGALLEGLGSIELPGGGGRSSVKTGDDGRYELRGVQAGKRLKVRASAKGHAPATSAAVEVELGTARESVDVQLGVAGSIKVTMAEAPAFASVQGTLLGADGQPDATAAPVTQMMRSGAVTLDGLRPGKWRVRVIAPGRDGNQARELRVVDVVAGETATVAF